MKLIRNGMLLLIIAAALMLSNCGKDEKDRFDLLTQHPWTTDSLLANGVDAGNPGQLLFKFKGDARFNKDGTGTFGIYTGTWWFTESKTQIIIKSDSLPLPLTNKIVELTESSFKITTTVPDISGLQGGPVQVRMTFRAK